MCVCRIGGELNRSVEDRLFSLSRSRTNTLCCLAFRPACHPRAINPFREESVVILFQQVNFPPLSIKKNYESSLFPPIKSEQRVSEFVSLSFNKPLEHNSYGTFNNRDDIERSFFSIIVIHRLGITV